MPWFYMGSQNSNCDHSEILLASNNKELIQGN